MIPELVYLITGANRGIGRGFVEALFLRPGTTIVVAIRDLNTLDTKAFLSLSTAYKNKFIVVKIDSRSAADAQDAVTVLRNEHRISKIDVVIINSGIAPSLVTARETPVEDMRDCFEVNVIGALRLFQATWPLLEAAVNPRFFVISSSMDSLSQMEPLPGLAYSCSKAAVNLMTRKLHFEHEKLVSSAFHPGFVQTDMGYNAADVWKLGREPVLTVQQCIDGLLPQVRIAPILQSSESSKQTPIAQQIDSATKSNTSGKFLKYDGQEVGW